MQVKEEIIQKAILQEVLLTLMYQDYDDFEDVSYRVVAPYGIDLTKEGNLNLRCYQIGGSSKKSEKIPGHKQFKFSKITTFQVTEEPIPEEYREIVRDAKAKLPKKQE